MSPVSPVFNTVESVRLSFNSKQTSLPAQTSICPCWRTEPLNFSLSFLFEVKTKRLKIKKLNKINQQQLKTMNQQLKEIKV